jgi:putative aldouronate transport system permease protein
MPFLLLIGISFSKLEDVKNLGFSLIPRHFTTIAYEFVFRNPEKLLNSFKITTLTALFGTTISIIVCAMCGYALSRENFAYKKIITWFLIVTMLFNGGLIPSFIINVQWFGLQNNPWIYILLGMASAYTIFVFRTFFAQLPKSLLESAFLDGATEFQVFFKIIIPLSRPVLATFSMFGLLARWNNFEISKYYMTDDKLYSIQHLLQNVLTEARMIEMAMQNIPGAYMSNTPPSEIIKFAICVLSMIPIMLVFPYFQKHFAKGMVVGSVKG